MSELSAEAVTAFQEHVVELTRAFGWHRPGSTPCGKPVPIAEAHALLELSRADSLTQRDLASALNLRKSTVSRVVANLQRHGWIQRQRSDSDGRALDVSLTVKGIQIAADLAAAREAKLAGILDRIPEHQRRDVMGALQTLIEAIHESDT
jgi:DNA-binding MarR family transcriptional regulator